MDYFRRERQTGDVPADESADGTWLLARRFRVRRRLKEGHGVSTYLALDITDGVPVVVKVAPGGAPTAEARERLAYEASVLRELSEAGAACPRYLSYEEESLVLAYPFVSGIPLGERLRDGALGPAEAIRVGISLLSTLRAAHELHIVHGDIKPAHLIVSASGPIRGATLVDFGFASRPGAPGTGAHLAAGTVPYLSPEQAGLIDCSIDGRSDLYAAGVVLYEALAGECPIRGATLNELLRNHLLAPPPRLRERGCDVPGALDEILRRLLQRDPRDRYQSAAGALADLEELERYLERGVLDPPMAVGATDRRSVITEPAFLGRQAELAQVESRWAAACAGDGGVVFVESDSGGGKTRFLREVATRCALDPARIFRGQGIDQSAQSPFQVLSGVGEQILVTAREEVAWGDVLRRALGDRAEAAVTALPQLRELFGGGPSSSQGPEDFGEIRNLDALSALFEALGTPSSPALVLLDDCQWADELTLKLLVHWNRRRSRKETRCHCLVVVAFRSEEVSLAHPLRRARPLGHVVLPRLTAQEMEGLVASMAGPVPPPAVELVDKLAAGSPFMAGAVLRGLVESGALVADTDGWHFQADRVGRLSSARKAASFLIRRLELLPPPYLKLLTVGAVLGKEFTLDLATELAAMPLRETVPAIEEARWRHIIWSRTEPGTYAFVHDKLREALLARLAPVQRTELHRRAAAFLEAKVPDRVFEIAYHFDAAGEPDRAFSYALSAAEQARAQHSLEIAEQQYRIASRGVAARDTASLRRIAEGLGDVLCLRGEYAAAEHQFRQLQSLVDDDTQRARIEGKLGDLAFRRGDVRAAAAALEEGMRLLGRPVPQSPFFFALRLGREIVIQTLHSFFPRLFLARRRRTSADEAEFVAISILSRLAYVYWFGRGALACGWAHLREMNLAESYPPGPELAQAYSEHAPVMSMVPWVSRGIRYAEKGLAIRQSLGDWWGQGQSLHFYGIVLYSASRYEECIEKCREAVRVMERTGDRWEVNTANWHIGFCLYRLGEWEQSVRLFRNVHRDGCEIGDTQAAGIALSGWSRASGGAVPAELVAAETARQQGDGHTRVEVLVAEGVRLLEREGRATEARRVFEAAAECIREHGLRQEYVLAALPWLATAYRREAEEARRDATPKRSRSLRRAQAGAVRRALRAAYWYRNSLPHALREASLLAAARGRERRAKRLIGRSIVVAREQRAAQEERESWRVRARLGAELGWEPEPEEASADREWRHVAAVAAGGEVGRAAPASLSLLDRFESIVERGRDIVGATSREEIVRMATEAGRSLLRAETCLLLLRAGDGSFADGGGECTDFSRRVVEGCLTAGGPVALMEGAPGAEALQTESLLLADVRSALAAPVLVRGEAVACLYLSHRGVGHLFGDEEKRIAAFIAVLAGAALENSAGFEALRRANEDLERFAYAASHDLKEPLRAITLFLGLLDREYGAGLDARAREFVRFGIDGSKRMVGLIDGLFNLSKITTGKLELSTVDADTVCRGALANLQVSLDERRAVVAASPLPRVRADASLLRQVFQNLVANAVKFCEAPVPRVTIDAERQDTDWRFRVRDNGIGIDPEQAGLIFEMFRRGHDPERFPGAGVGLAICKRIVERHGGRIGVESTPGEGALFWFTLPAVSP